MIARRFSLYRYQNEVVIFASGVSNSGEIRPEAFYREKQLIEQTLGWLSGRLLVYFSTTSLYDPSKQHSLYNQHKVEMEELIRSRACRYLIVRVSNVVGGSGNPHTVFNYFWDHIQQGKPFMIWKNTTRNLIDIDDFYEAVEQAITRSVYHNQTYTIANPHSVSPIQIVEAIEQHTGKKGNYKQVSKGTPFKIDTQIQDLLTFDLIYWRPDQYILRLLTKYYLPDKPPAHVL